ncbi:unnamed protein product [Oikopleura dioica]|uniref:Uncharacterized protein n=1 Tax=Oikopleura dioica TaxID=34765 RepID=E4WTG3_OIKDI|nr:unnamed protein product [Oikopleura dioica]
MKILSFFGLFVKLNGEKKNNSEYIDILNQVRQNYDSTIDPVLEILPEIAPDKFSRAIRIQRIVIRYIDSLKILPEKRKCVTALTPENIEELQIQVTKMKNVGELFQPLYSIASWSMSSSCKNHKNWTRRFDRMKKLTRDVKMAAKNK